MFRCPLTLGELPNQELPHIPPYKAEEVLGARNTEKGKCIKSHAKMQLSKKTPKKLKTKNLWQANFRCIQYRTSKYWGTVQDI